MSISDLLVLMVFLQTTVSKAPKLQEREEMVCQDEIAELDCPKYYTINIETAMFGRNDKLICRRKDKPVPSKCTSPTALEIVKDRCNLRQSCRVAASTEIFGNPCNYFSYLKVTYTCSKNDNIETKVGCEHSTLDIECPKGKNIRVVNALFGRKSPLTCHPTNLSIAAGIATNNCSSPIAITTVETRCNNLTSCNVRVESDELGDACATTFKYLEVDYLCN